MARDADAPKKNQFYALASIAIILALLCFGQEVLVPLALAVLFAFLLAPLVARLERLHFGRVVSTLLVVLLALSVIGALGWTVERRGDGLAPLCPAQACLLRVSLICRIWVFLAPGRQRVEADPAQGRGS